jgi:hypothetical protein
VRSALDYYWEKDEALRAKQREFFIRQVQLANELHKPFAVHSREAMQDTYDIMHAYPGQGLMHCFSGTREMALAYTKLGYYLSFGGALTFKHARHAVEAVQAVDEKWLLTETDCPYMAPEPVRGTRNEPANIPYIRTEDGRCPRDNIRTYGRRGGSQLGPFPGDAEMKRIQEVIVVEGRHDTEKLRKYFDCDTIETGGSSLGRDVLERIAQANKTSGVIIFTDPDSAGNRIRNAKSTARCRAVRMLLWIKRMPIRRKRSGLNMQAWNRCAACS